MSSGRRSRTRGSRVSKQCEEIDGRVKAFLERPIEGDWPHLWIDATNVKVRKNGRVVSVAVIVAVGVNGDRRREVLGLAVAPMPFEYISSPWSPSRSVRNSEPAS